MALKHGLGRGLGALIKDDTAPQEPAHAGEGALRAQIEQIEKNQLQPRTQFDEEALAELTASIKDRGVLQPLLVRKDGDNYRLIAGERRLRAAKAAGLTEVPVTVVEAAGSDELELALTENLQREDLNVLEEAEGYKILAEKFSLTQDQISGRVGKARASITNTMRLLSLPREIRDLIGSDRISAGHAKVLLGLEIQEEQILYGRRAVNENLSVRNLEKLIETARRTPRKPRASHDDIPASHISYLSDKLHRHFGTGIRLASSRTYANGKKGRGVLEIDYYSNDDLDRILALLGITED
jgi:ParB family chromosome partitioning protein